MKFRKRALGIAMGSAAVIWAAGVPAWMSPTTRDFPLAGGNLANQRYSALAQITPANIGKLGGAWMTHIADGQPAGNVQTVPIVVGGVMFVGGAGGDILAVNAATGEIIWHYRSKFGSQTNRGVAVA